MERFFWTFLAPGKCDQNYSEASLSVHWEAKIWVMEAKIWVMDTIEC